MVVGHSSIRNALDKLLQAKRLPCALLFSGVDGIGKKLVAKQVARTLFCQSKEYSFGGCSAENICKSCTQLDHGNHPDLHLIGESNVRIAVEEIRALISSIQMKGFQSSTRVIIIDNSENLTVQSSNALLKTLEEPLDDTFFILVTANPRALPITIRSRSQQWHFERLSASELKEIIGDEQQASDALTQLADGSVSQLELVSEQLELWEKISSCLGKILHSNSQRSLELLASYASKDTISVILKMIRIYCRNELQNEQNSVKQSRLAFALENTIHAEYLVAQRSLNWSSVLHVLLVSFLKTRPTLLEKM